MKSRSTALLHALPSAAMALLAVALLVAIAGAVFRSPASSAAPPAEKKRLDPAAWGSDHVGQPLPDYMESGECLFCHRHQAGATWGKNKHNRTIRDALDTEPAMIALQAGAATRDVAEEVQLLMGDTRAQRFLKRAQAYGHLDLLSTAAEFGRGRRPRLRDADNPRWDAETFATECAGCHTTAIDPDTRAFAAVSLDCYVCHGDADAEHANDPTLIVLADARKDPPEVVTSICASCHVRFGKSKASGLPYPTNFVAGDNLFKDFEVDWSVLDDPQLNPADAHVMDNVRDVVLHGETSLTCLSCHDVHKQVSNKHRELPVVRYCQHCHTASDPIRGHKTYTVHSQRCQY